MRFFALCSILLLSVTFASNHGCPGCLEGDLMSYESWQQKFHPKRAFKLESFGLDDDKRSSVFEANIAKIKAQNALYAKGESGYKFGVNQFSDLTNEEFNKHILSKMPEHSEMNKPTKIEGVAAASSIDWRQKGAVTPIKSQGSCGACWAFSTTGAIEGTVKIATGKLVSLSEKQLVDCSGPWGPNGCGGGWPYKAMKYVIDNGGIDSESDYAYQPSQGYCNKSKQARHVAGIKGYRIVQRDSVSQLMAALNLAPVSVTIDASALKQYNGGVLDRNCGTSLNHAVLAVGYTATNDRSYPNAWIVKNSWGTWFGVRGYVYIGRSTYSSSHGLCGILMQSQYATGGWVAGGSPVPSPTSPPTKPHPGPNPTPSPTCKDDSSNCAYWANKGECYHNPGYMLYHCQKSCNNCSACVDKNQYCQAWAQRGECRRNPGYMFQNCKKSCQICSSPTSIAMAPSTAPSGNYGNPFTSQCASGDVTITTGKDSPGSICAPSCGINVITGTDNCPSGPSGVSAVAKCLFQTSRGKYCALGCKPSEKNACGTGMSCELSLDTVYHKQQYVCVYHQQFNHVTTVKDRLVKASQGIM